MNSAPCDEKTNQSDECKIRIHISIGKPTDCKKLKDKSSKLDAMMFAVKKHECIIRLNFE